MKTRYRSLRPLVLWRAAERPLDWDRRFGRAVPRVLEIGCGNGDWLARAAREQPEHDHVGIDVRWGSIRRALRRLHQAQVSNAQLLLEDVRTALRWLFPPRSLHRVISLFPCPWRKARHEKHRLFDREFLRLLGNRLGDESDGALVCTDHRPYVDWILEQVSDTGLEVQCSERPPRYATKYERKWIAGGQEIFYELVFTKREHHDVPRPQEAALLSQRVPDFDPERFVPPRQTGPLTLQPKEFLFDARARVGMLRVILVEEELRQDVWIKIAARDEEWTIHPAAGCGFVPTMGLQRALESVRDAILEGNA